METSETAPHLLDASKRLAHQAFVCGENRLDLFLVELREEREHVGRHIPMQQAVEIAARRGIVCEGCGMAIRVA